MNQHKGAGHHVITREATRRLFANAGKEKLMGLSEHKFYEKMDAWQEYADRIVGAKPGHYIPSAGTTFYQAADNPSVQKNHSMADPKKSGPENLQSIREFIAGKLSLAKACHMDRDHVGEWEALGAAVHALEDSYSSAHVFRDPANPTDPYAKVEALNVFSYVNHTHAYDFDDVPVIDGQPARGTDLAASAAVAIILEVYLQHMDEPSNAADTAFQTQVDSLLHGDNVQVFEFPDDASYQHQLEVHYQNEMSFSPVPALGISETDVNATTDHSSMTDTSTQTHQPADSSTQINYTPDNPNSSQPDGSVTHHGVNTSSMPPEHSGNSQSTTDNSFTSGTTTDHATDHSQKQIQTPANADTSMPDGSSIHHPNSADIQSGEVNNAGTDHSSSSTNSNQNHDATYSYPLDVKAKDGEDPKGHQERKENQEGGKFFNWQSRNAWDMLVPYGTPVYAVADGVIGKSMGPLSKKDPMTAGLRFTLETKDNAFYYAHLSKFVEGLKPGQEVKKGQLLGYSGRAGDVNHLHFAAKNKDSVTKVLKDSDMHHNTDQPITNSPIGNGDKLFTPDHANFTSHDGPEIYVDPEPAQQAYNNNQTPVDANMTGTDGNWVHVNSLGEIQQPTDSGSIQYGAETLQTDQQQYYSDGLALGSDTPHDNYSHSSGGTDIFTTDFNYIDPTHHGADTSIPDNDGNQSFDLDNTGETHYGTDSSVPDHTQNQSYDNSITTGGHHGADSSVPDHGQNQSFDNSSTLDTHHGVDSSVPDDGQNQSFDNNSTGTHHGFDTSVPDDNQQQYSSDHNFSSIDHPDSASNQPDLSVNSSSQINQDQIDQHHNDHSGEASMSSDFG